MSNLQIANLCYQVVEEMMQYINREIEYDEVPREVRDQFERDYGIFNQSIVFWLKEQDQLKEKVVGYKKTCQLHLKDCSSNEIKEFILRNPNAYDYLIDISGSVEIEVRKQIEGGFVNFCVDKTK